MSIQQKYLIVVGGPTASGKTATAIALARHFHTEIISADSRQFFHEMNIGTAKPSPSELAQVTHHFIDSLSVKDNYNVGDFERDALALLDKLFLKHQCIFVAGGSGLYIKALCEGLDEFPEVSLEIRDEVELLFQTQGLAALQSEVAAVDPVYFQFVDQQNPMRLIRALSVYRASGVPFSSFRQKNIIPRPFEVIYLWLEVEREKLYERINARVDLMIENGLIAEAQQLLPHRHQMALDTVGYQELFDYFDGVIDLTTAIDLIKRNSRRYAKRQMTWMRRDGFWSPFSPNDLAGMIHFLEQKGIKS